jgi:3'-5' exoribonuclease-like protein
LNIFFDLEFTGLHQKTTLVSLGCISEDGREFYAEATDYDRSQVSPWIRENVIENLIFKSDKVTDKPIYNNINDGKLITIYSDREHIAGLFREWISQFGPVEFWGDCLAYDWVVFCELFEVINEDTAERLPRNIFYIPFDICTLMKVKGIDPDISREIFSGRNLSRHNALDDARIIRACYERLVKL